MPGGFFSAIIVASAILASTHLQAADAAAPASRAQSDAVAAPEPDAKRRAAALFDRVRPALEQSRHDDALTDLNAALALDPDNTDYLLGRAYVHSELLNIAQAIDDLDRVITLMPDDASGYRERAYARHYLGDLEGAYEDSARVSELTPKAPEALLARANAALWLGRFDEARTDAKRALKLAKSARNEEVQRSATEQLWHIDLWQSATRGGDAAALCRQELFLETGGNGTLIGDCSRKFLDAQSGVAKADALSARAIAWPVLANSRSNATEDLRMALAFDPANAARHANIGFSLLASAHLSLAKREFDRALAIEAHWAALAGRAAARLYLGDTEGAIADASASNKLLPNDAATGLLANHAFEQGDRDRARELYLKMYELGSRSHALIEQLKVLGVPDPAEAVKK